MAGSLVTPHFLAYLGSAILTNVMSKLSVSPSMFSNFSFTSSLSLLLCSSRIINMIFFYLEVKLGILRT